MQKAGNGFRSTHHEFLDVCETKFAEAKLSPAITSDVAHVNKTVLMIADVTLK